MERTKLNKEQEQQIIDAMVKFVVRVGSGADTKPGEAEALPSVAQLLLYYLDS
jgi:hypothetical protein